MKGVSPEARRRFGTFEAHLSEFEPGLKLVIDEASRNASIMGDLVVDIGAGVRRSFKIELRFQGLDPFTTPRVWDAGRHFRPDGERHVEDLGAAGWRFCLELDAAPDVDFKDLEGLQLLLASTRGFIRKQLMYEERKKRGHPKPWPGKVWEHGNDGYVQWLEELIPGVDSRGLRGLRPYLLASRLSANKLCPCGSGRKAGVCHRSAAARVRAASNGTEVGRAVDRLLARRRADEQHAAKD